MSQITKHILVKGKVHGVFFRKHTKHLADELNIHGWVRNTDDGHVEIMAQAEENAIKKLIEWCWNGSPRAEVIDVTVNDVETNEILKNFYIDRE